MLPLSATQCIGVASLIFLAVSLLNSVVRLHIRAYWLVRQLPKPKLQTFLLGHLQMLRPDHHRFLRASAQELGGIFRFRVLWQQVVVVVDAPGINVVLGGTQSLNKALEPASDTLLAQRKGHHTLFSSDTNSPYWRLIRKGTAPAFIPKNIKCGFDSVASVINQAADQLALLEDEDAVDINNVTLRMSMDVTGLVGFAKDFGTTRSLTDEKTDETFETLKAAMLELYRQNVNPARVFNIFDKDVRGSKALFKAFQQDMRDLVAEIKARGPPEEGDVSVAAHLMRLKDPATGQPLPDDLLASEFGVYFAAGIESAGNAITWTIYLLSHHPEVEAKLLEELDKSGFLVTAARPKPAKILYNDLQGLTYLSWVCKAYMIPTDGRRLMAGAAQEAMRVRPVASTGTTRRAVRDMNILGRVVPAGALILCPFDASHHFPGNWPDRPNDFVPERWAEPGSEFMPGTKGEQSEGERAVKRFLAFSTGPRQCIGQSLARMMHDLSIAMLYCRFSFRLHPKMGGPEGVAATEINRLTLQPGMGMWMTCHKRAVCLATEAEA